jgi:hypothetical protein
MGTLSRCHTAMTDHIQLSFSLPSVSRKNPEQFRQAFILVERVVDLKAEEAPVNWKALHSSEYM